MAELTPLQIADKWKRRLQQSTTDMTAGVNAVTENPATKAIAAQDKMVQNWNNSITSGKWARSLSNVSLTDWRAAFINKGIPRIQQGAESGAPKMAAYMTQALPYIRGLQATVHQMPNMTLQDSIARMTYFVTEMSKFEMT